MDISAEDWPNITDHRLIKIKTNYSLDRVEETRVDQHLTDIAGRYKALNFKKAPWHLIEEELTKVDWSNMESLAPTEALEFFHDKLLETLVPLVPKKLENPRIKKMKMQRMRRKLWKRHSKVENKLKAACTLHTRSQLRQQKWELQRQLSEDYMASNKMEEDEAVLRIKQNPRAFFSFCRSRSKIKAKVGPFIDPSTGKSNPSPDFSAECLRKQYESVFSKPRSEWSVPNPETFFCAPPPQPGESANENLDNISFSTEDIEQACSELRVNAAAGPDGVPAVLLKV